MSEWRPIKDYPHGSVESCEPHVEHGPRVLLQDCQGWCMCGYGRRDLRGDVVFSVDGGGTMTEPVRFMPLPVHSDLLA